MNQIIAVYKPAGLTSNQVVQKIKRLSGGKKVGHAGTLDPLARGVLVVGIGRQATKRLSAAVKSEKEYIASIQLGATSTTDDEEGDKQFCQVKNISRAEIISRLIEKKFLGRIRQLPPAYSAVKIQGREAYKLARQGKKFSLKPRPAEIKEAEILSYRWPYLKLRLVTGPGVYIRSIARDLGRELKCGGYLKQLERIRVGQFNKDQALTLDEIAKKLTETKTAQRRN